MYSGHRHNWIGGSAGSLRLLALLACLAQASVAQAQSRIDTSIASPGIPLDARPARAQSSRNDAAADPFQRPARRARADAQDPFAQDDAFGDDPDGFTTSTQLNRAAPLDGDLRPIIAPPVQDGTIITGEPTGPLDGGDPTREDGRAAADIAAFESPPAGYDPGAFSIELAPLQDRRPGQLFRFEPYQPIGVRIGSFVLFSDVETGFSATNNIFASPTRRSDIFVDVRPRVRLVSNWNVHAVEVNANGLASFHREFTTEDDRTYLLEARGRLDITRRTTLEGLASRAVTQERRGSVNSVTQAGQARGNIITDTAAATFNHRFNRLSVQLRGSLIKANFAPNDVDIAIPPAAPVIVSVDDRDLMTREVALRGSWEFNSELTVFAESALNYRRYDQLQGGFDRDSRGQRWRAGVSFGNEAEFLRGEISIGYGRQTPNSLRLTPIEGVLFDANLAWRPTVLTSLLLTANTDIIETTIGDASGGYTQTAGISVRHAFRRNMIATGGLTYRTVRYEGTSLKENTLTAALTGEYMLNRTVAVFGNYNHIWYDTTTPAGDYETDNIRIGLRLRK